MHRPVCITYDSTCDLTPQLLERFRIRTVPLTIQSGERVFPDDGRYTSADLYADYRSRGTLPKTAAVSPEEFKSFFAPILAEGYDIVHIDISAELSCTCQNAVLAAQELTERGEIHVVDSRQLSTGGGLLALQGAKLRDSGMAAADIAAELACDTVRAIENGTAQRTPQDNAKATYAPMLTKELSPIDWTQCERYVIDQVRGLIPWPVATAELGGKRFKIFRVEPTGKTTEKAPGMLVALDKRGLEIACGGGAVVRIAELQAEGGKRMRAADYFRGHPIEI